MSFRRTAIALVLASAAIPAFAQTGGTWSPGEVGFVPDPPKGQLSREEVKRNLATFLKEGGRVAAGEFGAVAPAHWTANAGSTTAMGAGPDPAAGSRNDPYANGGPN